MGLFGGSKSSSTNTTETNNIDQRLFQETGAIGATSSGGGTSTINMIDPGLTAAAFGMGESALQKVTDFATGALSGAHYTTQAALDGALSTVKGTQDAFAAANQAVATAYEDSKVGNRSTMMMGAIALGVVALVLISRKASA
jgi:hypothetical protein